MHTSFGDSTPEPEEEGEAQAPAPVKRSTGRLTRRQAEALNGWRRRLLQDQVLPGERSSPISNRPRASASDLLGVAVQELMAGRGRPSPEALWWYSDAIRAAARRARTVRPDRAGESAPVYPPVTVHLPPALGQEVLELCADSTRFARELWLEEVEGVHDVAQEAKAAGAGALELAVLLSAARPEPPKVQVADLVRMAIDRWIRYRVTPEGAAQRAVRFAREQHKQPHRAHRDSAVWS